MQDTYALYSVVKFNNNIKNHNRASNALLTFKPIVHNGSNSLSWSW